MTKSYDQIQLLSFFYGLCFESSSDDFRTLALNFNSRRAKVLP
jgi:hypothetical protein